MPEKKFSAAVLNILTVSLGGGSLLNLILDVVSRYYEMWWTILNVIVIIGAIFYLRTYYQAGRANNYTRVQIFLFYWDGVAYKTIRQSADTKVKQEGEKQALRNEVSETAPELLPRVESLLERGKLSAVRGLLKQHQSKQAEQTALHQAKITALAVEAGEYHCTNIVGPLIERGDLEAAKRVVQRSRMLLVQARPLNYSEVVASRLSRLDTADFQAIEGLLETRKVTLAESRLWNDLHHRIENLPLAVTVGLRDQLNALKDQISSPKVFRRLHHHLDTQVAAAERAAHQKSRHRRQTA